MRTGYSYHEMSNMVVTTASYNSLHMGHMKIISVR